MFCPNCGKELRPADWYYNYKEGIWKCPCGVVIEENWNFKENRWEIKLHWEGKNDL